MSLSQSPALVAGGNLEEHPVLVQVEKRRLREGDSLPHPQCVERSPSSGPPDLPRDRASVFGILLRILLSVDHHTFSSLRTAQLSTKAYVFNFFLRG